MPDWIAWGIAGISTAGLVTVWFVMAHRELARARQSVENAARQVRLHIDGRAQVRDGPYEAAAANSLNVSRSIYRESIKNYQSARRKLMNWLPALLLGYRNIKN